jgi:hypothetical protein
MGNSFCPPSDGLVGEGNTASRSVKIMNKTFREKFVRSFWHAIVQFASDSTRSIQEMIQLGRAFWPGYATQLQPSQVDATMKTIVELLNVSTDNVQSLEENKTKIEDEFLRFLGSRFYTHIATLSKQHKFNVLALNENGVVPSTPADETASDLLTPHSHSFLRSCLLLAAFICQHNSANLDSKVFSSHGNGKRRKSDTIDDIYGENEEDEANGSTSKPRNFALERVYSIFVTLVHLNLTADEVDVESLMDSFGSTRLQSDLWHLIGIGHIHPTKYNGLVNGEQVSLDMEKFTCSLTHEEAVSIADQHGIPLEQYLL